MTLSSPKAVISQSFPLRRKAQPWRRKSCERNGHDLPADVSFPLFPEARMINGVQAEETWVNFNKLWSELRDVICELGSLCGPLPSSHHKYAQNETENSVVALKSLILLPLHLACLCVSRPPLWIIYRCALFISSAAEGTQGLLAGHWMPMNCRAQVPLAPLLLLPGGIWAGQGEIFTSVPRKEWFVAALKGTAGIQWYSWKRYQLKDF